MSYQVLARKWRPRSFGEMVGQEHVLKALINALDHNRLHHAYLFTGTRGVGKTTVARILAKCLNCETGIGSTPCGACSTCLAINQGNFIDLIEVDAASKTKVEDTRELLDNVQYSPTTGRFKIYLIDEVHMLSNSSFNALLKTLEEPPAHVKFLLATTDPQKLPATILSRCLQFNLKNMSPEKIVGHLQHVLKEELVPAEEGALWQLARSADGSMRDALSLTDQAIAFGNGKLSESDVTSMLGTIDHKFVQDIVEALIKSDGAKVLRAVARFSEHAPDYAAALADLQTLLHRIAIAQALPEALDNSYGDREHILRFATQLAPEDAQLFYQTAVIGQRDLHLSSVPRSGFEMTLLRMLAFKPQGLADIPKIHLPTPSSAEEKSNDSELKDSIESKSVANTPIKSHQEVPPWSDETKTIESPQENSNPISPAVEGVAPVKKPDVEPVYGSNHLSSHIDASSEISFTSLEPSVGSAEANKHTAPEESIELEAQVQQEKPASSDVAELQARVSEIEARDPPAPTVQKTYSQAAQKKESRDVPIVHRPSDPIPLLSDAKISLEDFSPDKWLAVFQHLRLSGILQMAAANFVCVGKQRNHLNFIQDEATGGLLDVQHGQRLGDALSDYFSSPVKVDIAIAALDERIETPAQYRARSEAGRKAAILEDFKNDPFVGRLQNEFAAQLDESSLEITDEEAGNERLR